MAKGGAGMGRGKKVDEDLQGPPRCPKCGSVLSLNLIEATDEADGERELLLLLDCPRNDFHATMTYGDVVAALTAEVRERLAASRQFPAP